jgi:hypothetical protein
MAAPGTRERMISLKMDKFVTIFASRFYWDQLGGVAQVVRAVES